jgi:hypothetical protein
VHGHRSLEVSYPVSVTWWVCAGVAVVPAVQVCAGQAAKRGELVPCMGGQEAMARISSGLILPAGASTVGHEEGPGTT